MMNYQIMSTAVLERLLGEARSEAQAAVIREELRLRNRVTGDSGTLPLFQRQKAETLKTES